MLKLKHRIMATACVAIAGAAGFAPGAIAQTYNPGDIFGGGASLPAPYLRQTFDCYGIPTQLIIKGTPPQFETITPFDYTGSPPFNCATQHIVSNATVYYVSATSGTGILTVFAHDPTLLGYVNQSQTEYFPSVQFGYSETPLSDTDVGIYNNGGTETQGKSSVTVGTPGQYTCGNPAPNYANPLQCFGPLVQFPFSVDPVVFAYNSTYEKVLNADNSETDYHFNIKHPRADGSGGLRLSQTTYCKIFNGQITNWNDPAITADNSKKSLEDPKDPTPPASWSVPLQIVGRADSAGATTVFTRHLAAACAALTGNQYTTGTSTLPASLQGPTYNSSNPNYPSVPGETPGKYTLATLNTGIAQYVAFTATPGGSNPSNCTLGVACIQLGRIGYIGNDFVLPYVLETQANTYNLNSATLENVSNQWEAPTPTTVTAAFKPIQPPQSNANGTYCANCLSWGVRTDPADWVQGSTPASVLANPMTKGSYPIVGTANWLGYQCYASPNQTTTVTKVNNFINNNKVNWNAKLGILASAGLAPLPAQWRTAIQQTFVTNTSGLNLNIVQAGTAGACSVAGVVGG